MHGQASLDRQLKELDEGVPEGQAAACDDARIKEILAKV